jgi:hypothetical protein
MSMKDDEIIAEVRRVRAQIFKECGGTLEGLYARLKRVQKRHAQRIVPAPARRRTRSSSRN